MKSFAKYIFAVTATTLFSGLAFAQEAAHAVTSGGSDKGLIAIGGGLALGLAALGGGLGQAKAVSSALDGIARNPGADKKIFTPMIIGLAFIESLVIYALVIAILFNLKI